MQVLCRTIILFVYLLNYQAWGDIIKLNCHISHLFTKTQHKSKQKKNSKIKSNHQMFGVITYERNK